MTDLTATITRLRELVIDIEAGRTVPSPTPSFAEDLTALLDALEGKTEPAAVDFYEREFYPLSNFSSFQIRYVGKWFATSEHAYHWQKFLGRSEIQKRISLSLSAHGAFKIAEANKADRRPDWDEVKVGFMREIIRAKAEQHEYVRRKLLETGDRPLVEGSWRDDYWGIGPNGDGQNMLGKLWMELRANLRNPS